MRPHKHAEIIKAWADGAEIQAKSDNVWLDCRNPEWFHNAEYRIKPEQRSDIVYYGVFDMDFGFTTDGCFTKSKDAGDQIKLTFDGKTGKLKSAEVL
ncbi:hypothetical protein [Caudoviricetes sp.]|nr:hypothetical protein [Caudoviricetes sp.]